MFPLLFKRMLGANTARNRLNEGGLKSRWPKKANFMTERHKKDRLRLAYNFNVLNWPANVMRHCSNRAHLGKLRSKINDRVPPPKNVKELRQEVDSK